MPVWREEKLDCDVLVIGGGGAGLRAAITAKSCDTDVLLVTKMKVGSTSNTYISKAVIASTGWGPPEDNARTHMTDTIDGGRFLNDQSLVASVTERSHAEVKFLQECGVHFGMQANKPQVIKTPGHQYPRHIYGENWRGSDLVIPLKRRAKQAGVRFAEQVFVARLFAVDNRIGGATGITADGRFYTIHAKGANRLGGNALAEIFSMGALIGENAAQRAKGTGTLLEIRSAAENERLRLEGAYADTGIDVKQLVYELKQLMWNKVGVIRQKRNLQEALDQLDEPCPQAMVSGPSDLIKLLEYQNMRSVAQMVCRAALERTESRGSHCRRDFPREDNPNWLKNIMHRKGHSGIVPDKAPVSLDVIKMNHT